MSFLTIPSQEGLFAAVQTGKSDDEDDEEDDSESARLIPRCSPVPRKRGSSIFDETAEYMRIHLALSAGKRVSFADTTGGDLVDVREFHAFDSDEEEGSARWEEEEAKYRKPEREATYSVRPEFCAPEAGVLLQAVRANKVEVERIRPVEDEPLAFSVLLRVLNISFHKAVYVRSTMDSWGTYFDHPAEYVQGSNDGDTDQFSIKLSFAPPYTTHGCRIEFVVRYETSDGDYWANNSSMNYVATLLLSYKEDPAQTNTDVQQRRSILKPPKEHSLDDDLASEEDQDREEGRSQSLSSRLCFTSAEEPGSSSSGLVRPTAVCPVFVQPEIDVETAVQPSGSSTPPDHGPPFADSAPSTHVVFPGEQLLHTSSETNLQTNSAFVVYDGESLLPDKSQPPSRLRCELQASVSQQSINSAPSVLLPFSSPSALESKQTSNESQAERVEIPALEASALCPPATEMKLLSREDELALPAECFSCTTETEDFEREVAVGLSECAEKLLESSTRSAANRVDNVSEPLSPVAETAVPVGAEDEAPPSPELTESFSVDTRITEVSQDTAPLSASAGEEKEDTPCTSQDDSLENPPNTLSDVSEFQFEYDINRNLMPCVFFLSGVVSLSIVMQEPSALFFIGLLLVLHHL